MAVAHSAASESHTGSTGSSAQAAFSWTHTQTGTPQGVVVFVSTYASVANLITSVTYGGVALTRLTGGLAQDGAGELGRLDTFFLGSGLGTGNQTITVNRTNNSTVMYAAAATVTAGANTAVPQATIVLLQGDGTLAAQTVDDTSPGANSVRYAGCYSGLNAPPTAGTGSTLLNSIDIGNYGSALVRETTAGQGARSIGFTGATDDRAAVHLAIRELVPRTFTQTVGTFTLTGNAAKLLRNPQIDGGTGAFTLTGNDATFSKTTVKLLDATVGTFTLTGNPADTRHNVAITGDRGQFFLPERNMRLWSESFDNAAWTKTRSSITPNATTAPDGTPTADALIENTSTTGSHDVFQSHAVVSGKIYTASCYFKLYPGPITRYARLQLGASTFTAVTYININLTTGTINTIVGSPSALGITNVGNGWYHAWLTKTATVSGANSSTITILNTSLLMSLSDADGLSGIYIWGAQFAEGSLSDYDPTGPASATPASFSRQYKLHGETGTFSLTGNDASLTITVSAVLEAATGTFAFTGNPATFPRTWNVTAVRGQFTLTGNPAALTEVNALEIDAILGTFVLTGNDATFAKSSALQANRGIFTLTGQTATLTTGLALQADPGTFTLTGNPASLTELGAYEIAPITGAFTLTGNPAALVKISAKQLTPDVGTFNLTGQPTTFKQTYSLTGSTGNFTFTGNPALLTKQTAKKLTVTTGAFNFAGNPTALVFGKGITAERGQFLLTANPNTLLSRTYAFSPATSTFLLTGAPTTFTYEQRRRVILIF